MVCFDPARQQPYPKLPYALGGEGVGIVDAFGSGILAKRLKGRSRNWLLQADNEQVQHIISFISQSGENNWRWLTKKLIEERTKLNHHELKDIAMQHPCMTVAQLTLLTNCSHLDARMVLDKIEWE